MNIASQIIDDGKDPYSFEAEIFTDANCVNPKMSTKFYDPDSLILRSKTAGGPLGPPAKKQTEEGKILQSVYKVEMEGITKTFGGVYASEKRFVPCEAGQKYTRL